METERQAEKYTVFILSAGFSSRMGAFKPLLQVGEETALERIIHTARNWGANPLIAVTGHNRERLQEILCAEDVREAYNERFPDGMFTSIQRGIQECMNTGKETAGYILMLVDCPLVSEEALQKIAEAHRKAPDSFVIPCFRGKRGHPVFIPAQYAEEILEDSGDFGLRKVMDRHPGKVVLLETGDESVVLDMDTPEKYEEILSNLRPRDPIRFRGRLFLIRHGETEPHKEKIFLGQTDVPMSDQGRRQVADAGKKLADAGCRAGMIWSSDLQRAAETAEIIVREMKAVNDKEISVIRSKELREMDLGKWDGLFISEVKEKWPEAYQARGNDLIRFKTGHGAENFYDLRYRSTKVLMEILRDAEQRGEQDVVIVSHAGVIRTILSDVRGIPLEEAVKLELPRGSVTCIQMDGIIEANCRTNV